MDVSQSCSLHRCIDIVDQINFNRDEDHLNLFAQSATDDLVVPDGLRSKGTGHFAALRTR